ncbi:putative polyketide beta-ketoacyl synthase [Mycobacteroides abscessus subsp. abscessus]|nr:putative polyketide beta-ketoacyl synthase [Mycobacteroides abscessus subsp. abscessus]
MKNASVTPVAVIGLGCRLPGGIESPEQFWQEHLGKQSNTLGSIRGRWPARRPVCSSG